MQLDPTTDESFRQFLPGMQQEDDKALVVEFFVGKKLLGAKSTEAGREIFEDREFVKIQIKGQDKQVVIREVGNADRQKYPFAYQQFQHQKPAAVVGTPIEQLPGMGPSQAHNLKGINLRTVEDLANVSDENTLQRIGMGARDLVNRAKAWLTQSAPKAVELEQENARLRQEMAERDRKRDEEMAEMREQLASLTKPKNKGGRPRKNPPTQ